MSFDISEIDSGDTAEMRVIASGKPTNWIWVFAGPGHDRTIAQSNRLSLEALHDQQAKEQAQVNRKKWHPRDESIDERIAANVKLITERLLDWYLVDDKGEQLDEQIKLSGTSYPFSEENARKLLIDPRKWALLQQSLEFLGDNDSFMQRSAANSSTSQSGNSPSGGSKTA